MEEWRRLLARCGRKPGRKYVHSLRVATLRLEATLEYCTSRQQADASETDSVQRWRRQGKKLRQALGPVRQADVSLDKLARVRSWAHTDSDGHPVLPKECMGGIEEIERSIKQSREAAAKKLVAVVNRRRKRLNRLSRKVESAFGGFAPSLESGAEERIRAQIASVAADFPALHSENLHEFRKRVKKIRYLAEVFAPHDVAAAHQAALLKRMTGAVGEWHDWQGLTQEAARAEHGNASMAAAAEFLQAQAGRSLESARKLCRQLMTRLLKPAANGNLLHPESEREAADPVPRKPVVSVPSTLRRAAAGRSARVS
ncbi:MAG TPA: CHAD domain-containing protein [Terracidiphilus sp.]|nr:CHAD domain-containing protein [Terracidiphilus sp.]